MTQRLTNAEKLKRYRERLKAARLRVPETVIRAKVVLAVPPSKLSHQALQSHDYTDPTPRTSPSGFRFTINRRGISLPHVKGYSDGG
jgi:hypothetical protein